MKKIVYAYLHTHWDREWYRDREDFNIRLKNIFDIVIDELVSNRAPFFYFDGQVSALIDYSKFNQDKIDTVKKLIKEKKLAIGPYYVSADSYLVSFPLMLKNLDIGLKYSRDFSQQDFIGYMCDIFGISKSIFKALELKNIDKAMIWRGVNPKYINNNCNFKFGNINTLWLSQGYFNDFVHNGNITGLKTYIDKIFKYSKDNCLLPIGADHLGILKDAKNVITQINSKLIDYEIKLTNPFEYFKKNKFVYTPKCAEFLDNSDTYILQGVYSTRISQKIKNVEVENKLTKIVDVLNCYLGKKYDSYIDEIYKILIKNHAHDSICGCSLDSVANRVDNRFDRCNQMLDSILEDILYDFKIKHNINGKSDDKIGLFNLTNGDNIKTVKIKLPYILKNAQVLYFEKKFPQNILSDCYKIPVTEDICNIYTQIVEIGKNDRFSFNTVKIKVPKKKHIIKNDLIENDFISLFVKNKKIFIKDKKTNKEYLFKLTDIKDKGDSYNSAPMGLRKELILLKSEILYEGKISSALRLYYKDINIDVSIDNYSKYLRFNLDINNKKCNHKLQAVIVLNEEIKKTVAQDAVSTITRKHESDYNIQDYMPAKRPYELKTNCYPMQNFVSCNNLLIFTKGLHEYEVYKNELRICILRSIGTISNPKNPARAIPAGPDLKIPNAQLLGKNKAEFAICFDKTNKAFKVLDEFMQNYVTIDGRFSDEINYKIDDFEKNTYLYGINQNKKVLYNIYDDVIDLK